ncbi:hypothetical protein BGZ47_003914 [Haplosporangium gracile]|nr:hypothetical protein BGZ47_003914 [Haplosporangium gracile]
MKACGSCSKSSKTTSKTKLTISLEIPSKSFAAWTFEDVCDGYSLSITSESEVRTLKPFTDIQAMPLDTDSQKARQD